MAAVYQFCEAHWPALLLTFPVWSMVLMLCLYAVGIQYERGGVFQLLLPVALVGFLFDVFLQYTVTNVWFWGWPKKGEFTISMRLARLVTDTGWRGVWARRLARILNALAPSRHHI